MGTRLTHQVTGVTVNVDDATASELLGTGAYADPDGDEQKPRKLTAAEKRQAKADEKAAADAAAKAEAEREAAAKAAADGVTTEANALGAAGATGSASTDTRTGNSE
ncbi:hypothetical protein KDW74_gp08 [Mycobacterium phage Antsirabe]|uniref:Uncharacterized protein n=1 Tax=Mycobacterium phage Antsirabe TaxID=2575610 RepID=A0A5J6TMM2_9CAUD|nr:hypothetical protein KDW74_gp08 [Mycobacterium phage Antsirabe]QFG09962.1 hypothetical protein PBI_ANTSIRABE_8 [Mycobacterium phage Antsirabe]